MDKHDEKVIEYLAQHKNILWMGIIVLAGGLVGLVLTCNPLDLYSFGNIARIVFILIGGFLFFAMIIGLLNTDLSIKKYLKKGNQL